MAISYGISQRLKMLTKQQQLKNNKPKKQQIGMFQKKHKIKPKRITIDKELLYFNWLRSEFRACIAPNCKNTDIDYHHLKFNETDTIHSSSAKKVHNLVIPICKEHHDKGKCSFHKGKKEMAKLFTKESLTIIANRYCNEFLESSFCDNVDTDIELVFDDIL